MKARPERDETGAVAIMVALLSAFLLVLASFTVDIGLAYTYKRQAQTAADSAVLAAASLYVDSKVTCGSLDDNPGLNADAKKLADEMLQKNLPGATGIDWDVSCNNPDAELRVSYTATYDSPLTFGRIVSSSDHVTVGTPAAATFDRAVRGESGMRPWPICSNSFDVDSGEVTQIVTGVKLNEGCPGMQVEGTWGRYACPGYAKGNGSDNDDKPDSTLYWIRYGCPNPASPVPDQPDGSDPEALRDALVGYAECAAMDKNSKSTEFCLARDTGSAKNKKMEDAWQMVVDAGMTVELPVLCAVDDCMPTDAVTDDTVIPIYEIAVVHFCGIYLDGWASKNWPTTGPCAESNPAGYTSSSPRPEEDDDAFYVVVESVIRGGDDGHLGGDANLRLVR
jgi:Flp pilus assembly protein TadG